MSMLEHEGQTGRGWGRRFWSVLDFDGVLLGGVSLGGVVSGGLVPM
jgi:hypothetical protein